MGPIKLNIDSHLQRKAGEFLLLVGLLLLAPILQAGSRTGADFLKVPIGGRAVALGHANTASSFGADALNWNVAGLSRGPGGVSFSHQQLFSDNRLDNIGAAIPLYSNSGLTSIGLSITRLAYATQERREVDRRAAGAFGANDLSVGLGVARSVGRYHGGVQVKALRQQLDAEQATGLAADVGIMGPSPLRDVSMGLSLRNVGADMEFVDERYRLPLTMSWGLAYRAALPLSVLFDVHHRPHQKQTSMAMGMEFSPVGAVALRAGYVNKLAEAVRNAQHDETNRGNVFGVGGLSGGIGIRFSQFSIDYAVTPFGELGTHHAFTLSSHFGGSSRTALQKPFGANHYHEATAEPLPENRMLIEIGDPRSNSWWPSGP